MKQNDKILSSVIPLSILLVLVLTATQIGLFQYSFGAIEKYAIGRNMKSLVSALQTELDRISNVVFEWSAWDDTALFVQGQNPDFIQKVMAESTMHKQNLNIICIVDSKGNPLWSESIKFQDSTPKQIESSFFSSENLKKNTALWNHKDPDSCVIGYCLAEGGVLMLSSRPITNNANTGPVLGAVIMGRFLTDEFIASIAQQACVDFEWWNLRSEYTRKALQKQLSQITQVNPVYIETNPVNATAFTVLADIEGKDAVLIKFVMANEIGYCRDGLMAKCVGLFAIEGLVFIIYLASFVNKCCTTCRKQAEIDLRAALDQQELSYRQEAQAKSRKEAKLPARSWRP